MIMFQEFFFYKKRTFQNCYSKKGASGGIKPKTEITSVDLMEADSRNPSEDLPNQEKNQYWTVYWWEAGVLYTKGRKRIGSI